MRNQLAGDTTGIDSATHGRGAANRFRAPWKLIVSTSSSVTGFIPARETFAMRRSHSPRHEIRHGDGMKVFLSWSGELSHDAAKAFYGWLPQVIQQIDPWLSSESTGKGETWLTSIGEALKASNGIGLFFLSQEAIKSGWLLYEAGGIAALGQQRVCTVCLDMAPHDLKPPLSFFQATKLDRNDVFKLVDDLNKVCNPSLAPSLLAKSFDRAWPELESAISDLKRDRPQITATEESRAAPTESAVLDALRRIEARIGALERGQGGVGYVGGLLSDNFHTDAAAALAGHSVSNLMDKQTWAKLDSVRRVRSAYETFLLDKDLADRIAKEAIMRDSLGGTHNAFAVTRDSPSDLKE